jgi:hypothetical protein
MIIGPSYDQLDTVLYVDTTAIFYSNYLQLQDITTHTDFNTQ